MHRFCFESKMPSVKPGIRLHFELSAPLKMNGSEAQWRKMDIFYTSLKSLNWTSTIKKSHVKSILNHREEIIKYVPALRNFKPSKKDNEDKAELYHKISRWLPRFFATLQKLEKKSD